MSAVELAYRLYRNKYTKGEKATPLFLHALKMASYLYECGDDVIKAAYLFKLPKDHHYNNYIDNDVFSILDLIRPTTNTSKAESRKYEVERASNLSLGDMKYSGNMTRHNAGLIILADKYITLKMFIKNKPKWSGDIEKGYLMWCRKIIDEITKNFNCDKNDILNLYEKLNISEPTDEELEHYYSLI